MNFNACLDAFFYSLLITFLLFTLVACFRDYLDEKLLKNQKFIKIIFVLSSILNVIFISLFSYDIILNKYAIPYYERKEKIEYRDSQLSKLYKGELDCNLIYTNEDIYFELSKEQQLQYYTECKVIQEEK